MRRVKQLAVAVVICVAALMAVPAMEAQQGAPIPEQILTGKTVFVSNGGSTYAAVRSNQVYESFYLALNAWGKYKLVTNPANADLVFEISFSSPAGDATGGTSFREPQYKLVIVDAKTRIALWTIFEFAQPKNVEKATAALVEDVRALGIPVAPKAAAAPAQAPEKEKKPSHIW